MGEKELNVLQDGRIDLERLGRAAARPELHAPGERHFWDDPHIAEGMLKAHLDPGIDAASRRPEFMDRSVAWLMEALALRPGHRVLDLGCGPGLYCTRLARAGLEVVGVDLSENSLEYARTEATRRGDAITYHLGDYHDIDLGGPYDAVLCIYGQFAVSTPAQQRRLLGRIFERLEPGGYLALDVPTRDHFGRGGEARSWVVTEGGFWSPDPYILLSADYDYPGANRFLEQHVVVSGDGGAKIYRVWSGYYTPESISDLLGAAGFQVEAVRGDIAGAQYRGGSEWLAVVARKSR